MNQREIWERIAPSWAKYRTRTLPEAEAFLEDGDFILDIGCGSGRNFLAGKTFVGVDFSMSMLRAARKEAKKKKTKALLVCADAGALPFKPRVFEKILLISVLHTLKKRNECVRECARAARSNGRILVTVWNKDQPRFAGAKKEATVPWKHGGAKHLRYYYLYDEKELAKFLRENKLVVERIGGSSEKAFNAFSKNIVAEARVP